ncbi:MAG: hypothetical protein R2940_14555 [Syntrophotaleaceae bacterium]
MFSCTQIVIPEKDSSANGDHTLSFFVPAVKDFSSLPKEVAEKTQSAIPLQMA